jgi:hypothetical protein
MGAPTGQPQSSGKGNVTTPATSAQPSMGQPNQYPNTIGGWDNASIQPQTSQGKGNSGSSGKGWQPFQSSWTPSQNTVQPATNVQPITNVQQYTDNRY